MEGNDPGQAAVLIHDHGKVIAGLLHLGKQHVGLHDLRDKEGFVHCACHYILSGLILQAEVVLGVQNAHNIFLPLPAYRIVGMSVFVDDLLPFFHVILKGEIDHIPSSGADLLHRSVVKLKYILDDIIFFLRDHALLISFHQEHPDLLFRHGILILVGIDPHQPQDPVGRNGKEPYQRGRRLGHKGQDPGHPKGQRFRLLHGDPLRHQFSEYQLEISQHQGDHNYSDGIQHISRDRHSCPDQRVSQWPGKVIRREGSSKKSGQRDGHLDRRQEPRRLLHQGKQFHGPFILLLSHHLQFCLIHGDHRDLRACKGGVQKDQHHL